MSRASSCVCFCVLPIRLSVRLLYMVKYFFGVGEYVIWSFRFWADRCACDFSGGYFASSRGVLVSRPMFLVALLFFLLGILSMLPWVVCCDTIAIFFPNARLVWAPPLPIFARFRACWWAGVGFFLAAWRFPDLSFAAYLVFFGYSDVWPSSISTSSTFTEMSFLSMRGGFSTSLRVSLAKYPRLCVYVLF